MSFGDLFSRLVTIQVHAREGSPLEEKRNTLRQVAESTLFHFAFGAGVGLGLSRSWERAYYRPSQRRRETVQFPRRIYNSDLLSYYQLALSSDSLMLGYLALYKILEYFDSSASEKALHSLLKEKLVAPDFSHTKVSQLRQLTSLVRKYDQRMDEQRMLTTVLEQYFAPDELIAWVQEYEASTGTYFSIGQTVFGESHCVDLNPKQVSPSLARRIYHIRNVIVHNKEGESARFVPFSGQEDILCAKFLSCCSWQSRSS